MGYMYDKEIDNLVWGALNFGIYGSDSNEETYPGFGPSFIKF